MHGILGQVGSRQLVPINRNILVWTVYWDRLVPGSLSQLSGCPNYPKYLSMDGILGQVGGSWRFVRLSGVLYVDMNKYIFRS